MLRAREADGTKETVATEVAMLRDFFAANRRVSQALTPRHVHEANVFGAYRKLATLLMSRPDITTVVDVGAGKSWHFPLYYKEWFKIYLIGLDIDREEMTPNAALDEKIECDVVKGIPLPDASVDLITVFSGIEHFSDNEKFLSHAFAKLRPGGYFIAQFPSRFAPFALANRMLPARTTRRVLDNAMGGATARELGFRAYYDRTDYLSFKKLVRKTGFSETYHLPGYYSSSYCEFFVPLYLLSYAYDALRFSIGIKALASYNLWVLHKPDPQAHEQPLRLYAWQ
jgi:SAM-dependent methyltransferase